MSSALLTNTSSPWETGFPTSALWGDTNMQTIAYMLPLTLYPVLFHRESDILDVFKKIL